MKLRDIRLHEVSRRFGRHNALRHVTTTFRAGEIVMLLGPNGAGKTTLMRLVSTLLRPTRGQLTATLEKSDGGELAVDWYELAMARRSVLGLVSHASLIYHDLSARENLTLFGDLYGMSVASIGPRADALLKELDLEHAADRRVSEYSRGMRQRLSIARALMQGPQVLLLDEPFTGLDQQGCRILHDVLRRQREAGRLILMITHHLELPDDLVNRAMLLHQGRLARDEALEGRSLAGWYERGLSEVAA